MGFVKTDNLEKCCFSDYADYAVPPPQHEWLHNYAPQFKDISIWECLYNEIGNLCVYAAWCPKVEFYIVIYNFLYNKPHSVVEFFGGDDSIADVINFM